MGLDKDKWFKAVNKEHKQMVLDGLFQVVNAKDSMPKARKLLP